MMSATVEANMNNRKWILPGLLLALSFSLSLVGCKSARQSQQAHSFTCPHHPDVVFSRPTVCPKCGMELVEKRQ